jgi:cell division protein FtsZ
MSIHLKPAELTELRPRITVIGIGGAGGNAVNNMIQAGIEGVEFVAANTDAQALSMSSAGVRIQMGVNLTEGLGAGSKPEIGAAAAEEALDDVRGFLQGAHMLFITAGMGGGTGTGAAPIIARAAKDMGILTVGVVTKPFEFEGQRRMHYAEKGIADLAANVDTILVIPNQNLFRVANEKTTFADAFQRADDVLRSGVSCITDLMIKEGLINLDFADVRAVMKDMGTAMMGTGESQGDKRALEAAEMAISNPLLDNGSMKGAHGLLISITGSHDYLTLYEVQEAADRVREEVDADSNPDINIIVGAIFDPTLDDVLRVSVVATGLQIETAAESPRPAPAARRERDAESLGNRLRTARSDGRPDNPEKAAAPQSWEGPGRVTIEQRQPRRPAADTSRRAQAEPPKPQFEPMPPSAPRRRPRRPLTEDDFPELSGHSDDDSERIGREKRRTGLFSWMAGRARPRESQTSPGKMDEEGEPTAAHANPRAASADSGHSGGASENDPRAESGEKKAKPRINRGSGNGTGNSDEPFDIPDFFKRPLN